MSTKSFLECEKNSFERMKKYQLPHSFKRIGLVITLSSIAFLFINKFSFDSSLYRVISKHGILIGLLIISISKEKIEDELVAKIRLQSFSIAFIFGVIFTMMRPIADYLVDFVIPDKNPGEYYMGEFQTLWLLLSLQVLYFAAFKRMYQ